MSLFSVTAGIRNKIWSVLSMNIRTWILLVMQGLILLCMTLLLHIPAAGGVRLNMENSFLLRLTLPFPVKKSVITIPVSAVSLPGSLAIRKFWLMSQPQKKSMVNIRRQIFFATFVKNVETHIKTNAVKKALNRLIHQQVYHL